MTDPDSFGQDDEVASRPCSGPPYGPDERPRHPRPAGIQLGLPWTYASDFYPEDSEVPGGPLDLSPFADVLAAHWDQCHACVDHHAAAVADSPVLTTHVAGVVLLAMGINEASAVSVARALDPDGAAVALTIRNRGLPAAVVVAGRIPLERRRDLVRHAVRALVPTAWFVGPVSNFCPPGTSPPSGLGDARWLAELREEGHL